MDAIEKANVTLKGVLPKDYARPTLDKTRLGELIDLIGTIELVARSEDTLFDNRRDHRAKDLLGRVYEYFIGKFAAAEGKAGGEFFTPQAVVKLLVEMIEPFKGASSTRAAARAGCSCSRRSLSRRTAGSAPICRSSGKRATRRPGNSP